ncbi:polyprenyl synthetase family protein [Tessaracoccus sp. OH4464_COT-324]|uniref:polyprenyl synthetase family protein n=1 Tax=Tessaracoccus sp. OH4464_COT-324 TaxID=2491059 RepID=UPI000F6374FC|nr:polyprenyl synthetase family protein [Tessaracoccus sp. OH4464_COT-324]RRD47560.1 polyprenyl synthetase family protein [Tessaracoccus sp. OH4464_COT-324]
MLRDFDPDDPLAHEFRTKVEGAIAHFLNQQRPLMQEVGTSALLEVALGYALGGKRLRPAFCYWAHEAVGGEPSEREAVLQVAASLDVLHISALVHDDLIDAADTRRGLPAAHKRFEMLHVERGGRGSIQEFGAAAAVLLGDMLLMWSAEMFDTAGATNLEAARPELSRMRSEVTAGQFLDISAAFDVADYPDPLVVAEKVLEYKSASYSMRRPSTIGARLAGADDAALARLASFGSHVGHAFQLRDDLLGVWGDESLTGKPTGGDLREGKATVLVLTALNRADATAAARLREVLGAKDARERDIVAAAEIIEATGARASVEGLIEDHLSQGLEALHSGGFSAAGTAALTRLAELSVRRAY